MSETYKGKTVVKNYFKRWEVRGMGPEFGRCVFKTRTAALEFIDRNTTPEVVVRHENCGK